MKTPIEIRPSTMSLPGGTQISVQNFTAVRCAVVIDDVIESAVFLRCSKNSSNDVNKLSL